jgi:hypothetical protein
MKIIELSFKTIYILLLIRAIINYFLLSGEKPKQPIKILLNAFEHSTDILCKPFQNIFNFRYDASPIIAIIFFYYIGEPLTRFIFKLCLIMLAYIQFYLQ